MVEIKTQSAEYGLYKVTVNGVVFRADLTAQDARTLRDDLINYRYGDVYDITH